MHICKIIPSHIFETLAQRGDARQRRIAFENLNEGAQIRGERQGLSVFSALMLVAPGVKRRTIYDAYNGMDLPGTLVRTEGDARGKDLAVNEAYDGSGKVYDFFRKVFDRNSLDGKGMRLDSTVHYRQNFSNAFWNGVQMVYGDGDDVLFQRMTRSLDVIGHEMAHGITQFESGLRYVGQSGALNEHLSDVFGSLVKQYARNQKANDADWLIGEGLFTRKVNGVGIRSMKNPGTAYDDPLIGKDPQPDHMDNYVKTQEDNGGVHINSGIPNRAFYNLASMLGGSAWTKAGRIWYVTLVEKVQSAMTFSRFAGKTREVAGALYGKGSAEEEAVREAWGAVGIVLK